MEHVIYGLVDPFTKQIRYVGYTSRSLRCRLRGHIVESQKKATCHRHHWIRKLLSRNAKPEIVMLGRCTEKSWALQERRWIQKLRKMYGKDQLVNSTDGGEGLLNPSSTTRKKMSNAHNKHRHYGTGWHHTEEACEAVRKANLGRKHSAETRAKMSKAHKGRKFTAEHRAKISAALMGHAVSDATRQAVSETHRNFRHTPETRAQISASLTGNHIVSKQGRANIHAARSGTKMILNGGLRRWLPAGEELPFGWRFARA